MPPISDATIGSRFWIRTDFTLPAQPAAANNGAQPANAAVNNDHNSKIFTFIDAGGDSMAKSAIGKAELFAATHTLTDDQRAQETALANRNAEVLVGDAEAVNEIVNGAVAEFLAKNEGVQDEPARQVCLTAFNKLMATREFTDRARLTAAELDRNGAGADIKLDAAGVASLKNAVAGLAHMIHNGQISERASLVLADSNFYDASNRSDLLRLSAESAKKVKELFIGEKRIDALIAQCRAHLAGIPEMSDQTRTDIGNKINTLEERKAALIEARKAAVRCIKTDYLLTDPTGGVKSDRKFQKKQLDAIRNSLRAFRFDIERSLGFGMGIGETIRRYADKLFSGKVAGRMTRQEFDAMRNAEGSFNDLLNEIRGDMGIAPQNVPEEAAAGKYAKATENTITLSSEMNLVASAKAATHLSHITNDRIRYHQSGVEKRCEESASAVRNALAGISAKGGGRSVTFRAGADFVAGLNLGFVDAKLKAGGAIDIKTEVNVSDADGSIEATFSYGIKGHAGATAKLGVDPEDEEATDAQRSGWGAKATVDVSANVRRKVTKRYSNLEEFVRATSQYSPLVNPQLFDMVLSYGKAALRGLKAAYWGIGTLLHLHVRHSRMDQLAYSKELRDNNVFGPLAGVFMKKRNVEITRERKAFSAGIGGKAEASGGLYATENGKTGSNVSGSASLGYDYNREFKVKGKLFESFAKSFANCSAGYLATRFNSELASPGNVLGENDAWVGGVRNTVNGTVLEGGQLASPATIKNAIGALSDEVTALEDSAIGKGTGDKVFWDRFASKARILAIATSLVAKRAAGLDDAAEGAADAKAAATAALETLIPRLANPIVKVPENTFREKFFNVFNLANPAVSTHTAYFSFTADLLNDLTMSPTQQLSGTLQDMVGGAADDVVSNSAKNLIDVGVTSVGAPITGMVRDILPVPNSIQVKYTRTNFVGSDPRPWMQGHKSTLDIRVNSGLTLGFLVELLAKSRVKALGGLEDEEVAKMEVLSSLAGMVVGAGKVAAEQISSKAILPMMDMTLGEIAKTNPVVNSLLGAAHTFDKDMKAEHLISAKNYKTWRFSFGNDNRLNGISLMDEKEYSSKLSFNPVAWLNVSLELSSQSSQVEYGVLSCPTWTSLMTRAEDFIEAGNPAGFRSLLSGSKTGVKRLVQTGRAAPGERPDDKYWQEDCDAMTGLMADIAAKLDELDARQDVKAQEEAAILRDAYNAAETRMKEQAEDVSPNDAVDIAYDFFTVAAKIYRLHMTTA